MNKRDVETDILVLGGGPAGVVAGLGLRGLGYSVAIVATPRPYRAIEGLSDRALDGLRAAGCHEALGAIGPEVRRVATWNGETNEANRERLVDRAAFDAGLLRDAEAAGITVIADRARKVTEADSGWRADGASFRTTGSFLVEARGRAAPGTGRRGIKGPATTALIGRWQRPPDAPPRTAVTAFEDGWCWLAALPGGDTILQIFVSSGPGDLPPKRQIADHYKTLCARIPEASDWLADAQPTGDVTARSAGPAMAANVVEARSARVGDAALAVDPLSGHGVFQAIGTALALPAVINTLLRRPENRALAAAFYRERVEDSFWRMCRVGRDFYRTEARWPDRPFWTARRAWPDDQPAHGLPGDAIPVLARRPVSESGFIVGREVIVTADYPRGVWRVHGVALLDLMRSLATGGGADIETLSRDFAETADCTAEAAATALSWLLQRGLVERTDGGIRLNPTTAAQLEHRGEQGADEG